MINKSDKHIALENRVRETPLLERLENSAAMIGKMCSEGRPPKMSIPVAHYDEDFFICTTLRDAAAMMREPIPMVLHCPNCGTQHIDAPEPGTDWNNPPHKSHKCRPQDGGCGTIWRASDVPTNGVAAITTRGDADTWPLPQH
jgi:hypothetical protein